MASKKSQPPPRKRRRAAKARSSATPGNARLSLTSLPIEILAEILIRTCSPATVLAVSRTCSFLYNSLALNPAASFIWRSVRDTCNPGPLPEPPSKKYGWGMDEAKYAALVFGDSPCEMCGKNTREMYMSFAIRARLCGNWHCRRKFPEERLVRIPWLPRKDCAQFSIPSVENNACFRTLRDDWPNRNAPLFRRTDFENFQFGLAKYDSSKEVEAVRNLDPSILPEQDRSNLDHIQRCNADIQRVSAIMKLSSKLSRWKVVYNDAHKRGKRANNLWTKNLAEREGWDFEDLVASQTYGSMQKRKNYLVEEITLDDVTPIRSAIETELLAMKGRRQRQNAEASHRANMSELKKIYERMRCGTTDGAEDLILPTLGVFFTLPSVRLLKGSPDPSAAPPNDIKSSPLASSLVKSDMHTWVIPVEKHLMRLLGYPNRWQSASARTLPPLKRVTARFFCRRCGKVGERYKREGCLDFKGVCSHVCVTRQGKQIEGGEEEAEEGETTDADIDDESGPEGGKRRRKKKSVRTLDWTVEVFEKDEKAISLIRTLLGLTGLSEEDPSTVSELQAKGGTVRCTTCTGWVVMDFETAIGHAHRHETMQIELLPASSPEHVVSPKDATKQSLANSRLAFERGTVGLLLGQSRGAHHLLKRVNYGCRHCIVVDTEHFSVDVSGKGAKARDFNALRSHSKGKHGISDIRDEDFFCYTCIEGR